MISKDMQVIRRSGTTLIEVMLAIVILLIMALAGASFIFYSSGQIGIEKNKRVAMELANARLEEMRFASYVSIAPGHDYYVHKIKKSGSGGWDIDYTGADENVTINNMSLPIVTTVQYVDEDGGFASYDYLKVDVEVNYSARDASQKVMLTTFIGDFHV